MRYTDDIIEEVRTRNDIVDVISGYVKLTKRGSSYFGLCPFHNEKTPSFSVTPGKQMYYCFGCGAGGNVFTFLMQYENYTFTEALQHLADRCGVELPKMEYSARAKQQAEEKAALLQINKEAAQYFYYQLRTEKGKKAYQYLTDRGLTPETMKHFGLGYSDKYSNDLYRYMKKKGYRDTLLKESGLFNVDEKRGMYDKFWNRVIFPIMDVNSRVIGFGGRVIGEGKPKYLNSPETKIFDKSRNLYGLHAARSSRKKYLILCEGYMDVIAMHQAGFTNAVASLGTALTSGHASLLKRYTDEVLLLYDSDEAGIRAAIRGIPILKEAGISARVVSLKPYKDPDEFIKAQGAQAFEQRLETAMNSFMFQMEVLSSSYDLSDPQEKTKFFREASAKLLEFPDELERNNYIQAMAEKYQVAFEDLRRMVNRMALEGTSGIPKRQAVSSSAPKKKMVRESGAEQAQKLLLTWLVNEPEIFSVVEKYVEPEDFTLELYQRVARLLYQQHRDGKVNPARLLNQFEDSQEQTKVAAMFNASIHLESEEERSHAFADTILRIKEDSWNMQSASLAADDLKSLQQLTEKKKKLEELRRRKDLLHISLD
ncbi:MAG TPA: DNA primase [Candidatus Blautia gallistercoris]|uniref:DNA primase n=1 Tax=Candidatus Blautia gallistercoris TaxID=2838490 RepID=A0A9D1WHE7_9FIRM|nr:DNA primase [Candidatus Blautia gallistercoris]